MMARRCSGWQSEKEKATKISLDGLYLCRRRPTLPHTFACSTIGPAGLDFRVRDGNGYFPRGKITGFAGVCETYLAARSPASSHAGPGTPIFKELHRLSAQPAKSAVTPSGDLSQLNSIR